MKKITTEHRGASKLIPSALQDEIFAVVQRANGSDSATKARQLILTALRNKHGWSDEVKLSADAKISITSRKSDIGLCVQTGNMGRFYADLLKLEYLHHEKLIKAAIYILPTKDVARAWGENIAHYERFSNEVQIFSNILKTPVLIVGIGKQKA